MSCTTSEYLSSQSCTYKTTTEGMLGLATTTFEHILRCVATTRGVSLLPQYRRRS
jgi:hypothetical protein